MTVSVLSHFRLTPFVCPPLLERRRPVHLSVHLHLNFAFLNKKLPPIAGRGFLARFDLLPCFQSLFPIVMKPSVVFSPQPLTLGIASNRLKAA